MLPKIDYSKCEWSYTMCIPKYKLGDIVFFWREPTWLHGKGYYDSSPILSIHFNEDKDFYYGVEKCRGAFRNEYLENELFLIEEESKKYNPWEELDNLVPKN